MQVAHAVEAARAVGWVIDAGFAGRVAGFALPIAARTVSDGACGTDSVAVAFVHKVAVSTIVADKVLSAPLTANGTSLTDRADGREAVVAAYLACVALKQQRIDAAQTDSG